MKKLIGALMFMGCIAGGVAFALTSTPERTVCVKMGQLCGAEGSYQDLDVCVKQVEELRKVVGDEPIDKAASCVAEANSCIEGTGCIAGAGYSALPSMMKDFAKGFDRANK